jgi:hypothetical protein
MTEYGLYNWVPDRKTNLLFFVTYRLVLEYTEPLNQCELLSFSLGIKHLQQNAELQPWIEVNDQLHALAALISGKEGKVPIE